MVGWSDKALLQNKLVLYFYYDAVQRVATCEDVMLHGRTIRKPSCGSRLTPSQIAGTAPIFCQWPSILSIFPKQPTHGLKRRRCSRMTRMIYFFAFYFPERGQGREETPVCDWIPAQCQKTLVMETSWRCNKWLEAYLAVAGT